MLSDGVSEGDHFIKFTSHSVPKQLTQRLLNLGIDLHASPP